MSDEARAKARREADRANREELSGETKRLRDAEIRAEQERQRQADATRRQQESGR